MSWKNESFAIALTKRMREHPAIEPRGRTIFGNLVKYMRAIVGHELRNELATNREVLHRNTLAGDATTREPKLTAMDTGRAMTGVGGEAKQVPLVNFQNERGQ